MSNSWQQPPSGRPPPPYSGSPYDPPAALRHSGLGIASCIIAVLVAIGLIALIAVAGIMEESRPGGLPEEDPVTIAIGLAAIVLACLDFAALGLGVGGLFQANRNRALPIVGIVISVVTLVGVAILAAIGMAMESTNTG